MTSQEFKYARESLGLSVTELSIKLGMSPDGRNIRRWEDGTRPPNPVAVRCLKWFMAGFDPDALNVKL